MVHVQVYQNTHKSENENGQISWQRLVPDHLVQYHHPARPSLEWAYVSALSETQLSTVAYYC